MAPGIAPRAAEYELICDGPAACVRLAPGACAAYKAAISGNDELSTKRRTHLRRYFHEFCEHRNFYTRLNPKQFKREDNLKDGRGGDVAIWTFKAPKWRVYGAILTVNGKPCFVGTRVDADKKQDKANQTLLRAAAKDIGLLVEYRP